jgi:AraC-like DNA-binding protein
MVDGPRVPRLSWLGVQTVARHWRSWSETYFVMVMFTPVGMARLFPHAGADSLDRLLELNALIGDRDTRLLGETVDSAWRPELIARVLNRWLLTRLDAVTSAAELPRLAAACDALRHGQCVDEAAKSVGVSRRQLQRWFQSHVGASPRQFIDVQRLQNSVRAAQRRVGEPIDGFSDQSHQIRTWRARLGVTPGAYQRAAASVLVERFKASSIVAPAFYL